VALVAVGTGVGAVRAWFSQTFQGFSVGTQFTEKSGGNTGGKWATITKGVATVADVANRKGIAVDTSKNAGDEIAFTADAESTATIEQFDFSICTKPMLQDLPELGAADKGALTVRSDDDGETLFFCGYTAGGWTNLYWNGFSRRADAWFDCRATFDYSQATAYVTYWARGANGTYVPLADAQGVSRFQASSNARVKTIAFCGSGTVGDFAGGDESPASHTWTGPSGGNWDEASNWSPEVVPGNGENATIPSGKTIVHGQSQIITTAPTTLAIYEGDYIRIVAGKVELKNARDFGRVIVDPGATLVARGTFGGIEFGYASTLNVDAANPPEVVDRAVCVDDAKIDLTKAPGSVEGLETLVGPFGSGGTPLALTFGGKALEPWTSAWHGKLDGRMGLWFANGAYTDRVAVWTGDFNNILTDTRNWSGATPGSGVAAEIGVGQPHMDATKPFAFARRFEIGKGGKAQVDMTDGAINGAQGGGAMLLGTEDGEGTFVIDKGTVETSDSLWRHAITAGDGATGALLVRGGAVTADGDLSIGDTHSGRMTLSDGSVSVAGSFGVGNEGSLTVSGGSLTVGGGSTYLGRSTGEVYSVAMNVTNGAVTNEDTGVFMVGSMGARGSLATLEMTSGEIYAGGPFICGGYRSAAVNVLGGTLKAREIVLGKDLLDASDYARFAIAGGVETTGFSCGANGTCQLMLAGGAVVATAENADFFKGFDRVDLQDQTTISCAEAVTTKAALIGEGGLAKAGLGTFKVGGYASWAGKTIVAEGTLDMDGGMVQETEVASGANLKNAKRDDVDTKTFISEDWINGTASTSAYVRLSFSMTAGEGKVAVATAPNGVTNGAFRIVSVGDGWGFSGWTAFGWTDLAFADGTAVTAEAPYEIQMLLDFSVGKPYVFYYVKKGGAYGRLVSLEKLTAFPMTLGLTSVKAFAGVTLTKGEQLSVDVGTELYWIGGAAGSWNDAANWSAERGGSSVGRYPTTGYTATIEDEAAVTLANDSSVDSLVANAPVTLVGGELSVGKGLGGGGSLILQNASIDCGDVTGVISLPLEIPEGSSSAVKGNNMTLGGALRGAGTVELNLRMEGDTSGFRGEVSLTGGAIAAEAATHNDISSWKVSCFPFVLTDVPVAFGVISGTMEAGEEAAANVTISAGNRNEDCSLAGSWKEGGRSGVRWMAAANATLTYSMANTAFLDLLGGGRVVLAEESGVPDTRISFDVSGGELLEKKGVSVDISGLLKGSTAPIVYHDDGMDRTWTNALAASNAGGFVKRGTGTLTWLKPSAAVMDVTVESGALVVPFGTVMGFVSLGADTQITVDLAGAAAGGVVFAASGANRKLEEPYLHFANKPEGFTYDVIEGPNNSLIIVSGSSEYEWTGEGGDEKWSNVTNWSVKGVMPTREPKGYDTVSFVSDACTTVRLDVASAAAKIIGRGDVQFVGSRDLSVGLAFVLERGRVGLEGSALSVGTVLDVHSVCGSGTIDVTEGMLTVSPDEDETDRFAGVLGVTNLVKRGAGTFAYRPAAALSGVLAIGQGMFVWDCAGVADQRDAVVTMAAGATLDLNGNTVTAQSFTGAGTVTNGVLKTVDGKIAQSGGALTVPAVEGMHYVASRADEPLRIQASDTGIPVTIDVPATWFVAGASGRRAIYCNSGEKYITWNIAREGVRAKNEGDGWWSIPCGGFAVRLQ